MKKTATILLSAALTLTLSSCATGQDPALSVMASKLNAYESTIHTLGNTINELQQSQQTAKKENEQRLDELSEMLEALKKQEEADKTTDTSSDNGVSALGFKYIVTNDTATITGYTGTDKKIVIPANINGYKVTSIADGAFERSTLTDVIISDGIESIGWFAFGNCANLKSITIPSSVTSIGYGALGTAEAAPFIYCHSDSFALSYAKSYGLAYAVI